MESESTNTMIACRCCPRSLCLQLQQKMVRWHKVYIRMRNEGPKAQARRSKELRSLSKNIQANNDLLFWHHWFIKTCDYMSDVRGNVFILVNDAARSLARFTSDWPIDHTRPYKSAEIRFPGSAVFVTSVPKLFKSLTGAASSYETCEPWVMVKQWC